MNSKTIFLLFAIIVTVSSQCILICNNIFTDQLYCQGMTSEECNCAVYEKDVPPCVSCKLAAGESVADVAVYTSLLVTCPGGMAYLSTVLPGVASTTYPATTTPVKTVGSGTSSTPVATVPQATVTVVGSSGGNSVQAGNLFALVLAMVVAIAG